MKTPNVESYSNVSLQFIMMQMSCECLKETYFCFRIILKKFLSYTVRILFLSNAFERVKSVRSLDYSDQPQGFQVSPVYTVVL